MQTASVAHHSIRYVHPEDSMIINILQAVKSLENETTPNEIWKKVVEDTGTYIPRALFLSKLEILVSIGALRYRKRKTELGIIREYMIE